MSSGCEGLASSFCRSQDTWTSTVRELGIASYLSFIIIDPDGTAGPRGPATNDESGVDAREQLAESRDRRVQAVENAIVEGSSQATRGDENRLRQPHAIRTGGEAHAPAAVQRPSPWVTVSA